MKSYFAVLCLALLLVCMAGCSPLPAAPLPAAAPPATLPPPTAAPPPSPTPVLAASAPFAGLAEWDLLVIGDGSLYGVGPAYARLIEADMGVKVKLWDCARTMDNPITEALAMVKGTSSVYCGGKWPDLLRDAEVIVLFGTPTDSYPPPVGGGVWNDDDSFMNCIVDSSKWRGLDPTKLAAAKANIAKSCAPETFAKYRADWSAALDGIFKLRAGTPVILRTTDYGLPFIREWDEAGVRDVCTACIENSAQVIREVAAEYGVPVAMTMDALNGPDHNLDLREKGYATMPLMLPSAAGAQRVAEALQETGYAYSGK